MMSDQLSCIVGFLGPAGRHPAVLTLPSRPTALLHLQKSLQLQQHAREEEEKVSCAGH